MGLKEQIEKDFKKALKERKEPILSVLRMLKTALKNKEIELGRRELKEEEIQGLIRREIKLRKDALEQFKKANRDDLIKKEEEELKILSSYLGKELNDKEIKEIIEKVILQTKPQSEKEFGKLMGDVMKEIKGRAEGSKVADLLREELAKYLGQK